MSEPGEFRSEVRSWLEENCPPSMRTPMTEAETVWGGRRETFVNPESRRWLELMAERIQQHLVEQVERLQAMDLNDMLDQRYQRLMSYGN